jgi:hypothetical protein
MTNCDLGIAICAYFLWDALLFGHKLVVLIYSLGWLDGFLTYPVHSVVDAINEMNWVWPMMQAY